MDASPSQKLSIFAALASEMVNILKEHPGLPADIYELNGCNFVGKLRRLAHVAGITKDPELLNRAAFFIGVKFEEIGYVVTNTTPFLIIIGQPDNNLFYEDSALNEDCGLIFKDYERKHRDAISVAELLALRPPSTLCAPGVAYFVYKQLKAYYRAMEMQPASESFNIATLIALRHELPEYIGTYLDVFTASVDNVPLWDLIHAIIPPAVHILIKDLEKYFKGPLKEFNPFEKTEQAHPHDFRALMIMYNHAISDNLQRNIGMMAAYIANTRYTPEFCSTLSIVRINIDRPIFEKIRQGINERMEQVSAFCKLGLQRLAHEALMLTYKHIMHYSGLFLGKEREKIYTMLLVHTVVKNYDIIKLVELPTKPLNESELTVKLMLVPSEYEFTI